MAFDDLFFDFRPSHPWLAHRQSKTATVHFAVGATLRLARDGVTANALDPGAKPDSSRVAPRSGESRSALGDLAGLLEGE